MQNETNVNATETNVVNNETANAAKKEKMQKVKDAKKNATNVPKKIVTKESKQGEKILANLNLKQFANKLQSFTGKETKTKDTIYNYPSGMNELEKSGIPGKKFRNGLRNAIERFANNAQLFAKYNRLEDLKAETKKFTDFYKANYRLNDFSVASISQSKNDAKGEILKLMLEIFKEVSTKIKK